MMLFSKRSIVFLCSLLCALCLGCMTSSKQLQFYVFSDTHCLDTLSRYHILDSMITDVNTVHQEDLPLGYDHLVRISPKGLLISGDLTDDGRPAQWSQFQELFGLNGNAKLKMPVYENYGNHDGDTNGIVRTGIKARNLVRKKVTTISSNGMHYSWDWNQYHFVSLGSYPSEKWDDTCQWCHYFKKSFREPQNSLGFLKEDLSKNAAGKKVILYFHYGWDSFSKLWWTEAEQENFYQVIKDHQIVAIFTGHNHATGHLQWKGYDVYSAGSPQAGEKTGSYLVVRATQDSLYVLERKYQRWGEHRYAKKVQ